MSAPVSPLHDAEMVLPAAVADAVRRAQDELPLVTHQHPLEELLEECRRNLRRLLITSCIGLGAALAFGVIVLARVHGVAW